MKNSCSRSDEALVIAVGALRGYGDTAVPMLIAALGYWAIGFAGAAFSPSAGITARRPVVGAALGLAVVATLLTLRLPPARRCATRAAGAVAIAAGGLRA